MAKEAKSRVGGREITWSVVDVYIVQGLIEGLDDSEMARRSGLSLSSLKSERSNLSSKFGGRVRDALGIAVAHAVKQDLVDASRLPNVRGVELDKAEARALADLMIKPQEEIALSNITSVVAMKSVRDKFGVKTDYQAVAVGVLQLKAVGLI